MGWLFILGQTIDFICNIRLNYYILSIVIVIGWLV